MSKLITDKIKKKLKDSPLLEDVHSIDPVKLAEQVSEAKEEVEVIKVEKKKDIPKLHLAYNLYYDQKNKHYKLVTIEYNPKNLDYSRVIDVKSFGDNLAVVNKKLADIFALKLARQEEAVRD